MADGLLGSFDNVMAGLTADEIDAIADPGAGDDVPTMVPHRVVDTRAQAVADRLLRRVRRLEVVGCLFVIADQPGQVDDAAEDRNDHCTIDDGHTIVIGRGDAASDADPLQLLVSYGIVSRQHCAVSRTGDVVTIADTGSANGTVIVRDTHVVAVGGEPVRLLNGDVVATAGGHRPFVRFEIDAGPDSLPDSRPEGATS